MLAVIIVNYRTPELTLRCLESVIAHSDVPITVFVIENGSSDDSWQKFVTWQGPAEWSRIILDAGELGCSISSRQVTFVKSSVNRGFAGGNNLALAIVRDRKEIEMVWLLNSDTELCGIPIGEYTRCFERMGEMVGMLGCVVRYYDEPRAIQGIGGVVSRFTGCSRLIEKVPYGGNLDFVFGASMLVRNRFIRDVGLMSEDYFLYYEEVDWAMRGRAMGYAIDYTDRYTVLHKAGKSIGTTDYSSLRKWTSDYYGIRNRYLFVCRFYPYFKSVAFAGIIGSCFNRVLRSEFRRAWAIFKLAMHIKVVIEKREILFDA